MWGAYPDAVLPGLGVVEGGQTSTGSAVAWFRRLVSGGERKKQLTALFCMFYPSPLYLYLPPVPRPFPLPPVPVPCPVPRIRLFSIFSAGVTRAMYDMSM